ncbi:MAG: hypothetical protein JKX70_11630 [Phycisphaerales bacterium]|nr:hypothetical protein [Phycisphaerales bacterium]
MKNTALITACALVALAGMPAGAQVIDWALPIDGNWNNAANWNPANVPNGIGEDAILGLIGAYTVITTTNYNISAMSITNPMATLSLGSNITHTLNSDLFNDGTIIVNAPGTVINSHLSFVLDATISGSGSILLNAQSDPLDAQILANSIILTHSNGHTIHGSGNLSGNMLNMGNIIADDPLGAGLRLLGTVTQSAGGNTGADGGTLLLGNAAITTGGELITLNGGVVQVQGNTTIGSIINSGDLNILGRAGFLSLNGDIQNDGLITVNSDSSIFNAHIRFDTAATIDGDGTIRMQLGGGDLNDAQLFTGGAFTGTIGANQTVVGAGRINSANGGNIVILGTITADVPGTELQLLGLISGDGNYNSNDGIMGFSNGMILDGGTFDSTGVGVAKLVSSGVATLSNVTNNGTMGVNGNGGTVALTGPITNNGTFNINDNHAIFNSHLRFDASTAINGTGTVHMFSASDLNDAQLFTNGVFTGTIGSNQTVDGSGRVDGRNGGIIVNNGVINGNHAIDEKNPAVQLQLLGNHDGTGGGMYRSDDGILDLGNGLILDGGTFDTSGVGIVSKFDNGIATLSNVTNLGEMGIRGQGGAISLVGPMVNEGRIRINSNANIFNAHLRFDATAAITGNGTIHMQLGGTDLNDAQLFTSGVYSATIGANQTIEGAGRIDGRDGGTIVNLGTINGNDATNQLRLEGNHTGGGIYRSDDGVLGLSGGLVLTGGTFDSSGTGVVGMTAGGTATLSGVTNIGTMIIQGQGGVVGLTGPLTNNGTILMNSNDNIFNAHIRFLDATEINGTGTINMELAGSFGDAQILNDQGFVGTIGSGQTITGSGLIVGEMKMDGTFDPSSDERRFDVDSLNFSATSGIVADLGGLLAGEYDRLTVGNASTINLDGTLTVNLDPAYVPIFGDSWDIIDGGTINGLFANENMPPAGLGQVYRVIYESDRVYVILTCDADLSGDGLINFFDVAAFLGFFGAEDVRGDLTGDGNFNFFDVSLFLQLFGSGCEG